MNKTSGSQQQLPQSAVSPFLLEVVRVVVWLKDHGSISKFQTLTGRPYNCCAGLSPTLAELDEVCHQMLVLCLLLFKFFVISYFENIFSDIFRNLLFQRNIGMFQIMVVFKKIKMSPHLQWEMWVENLWSSINLWSLCLRCCNPLLDSFVVSYHQVSFYPFCTFP